MQRLSIRHETRYAYDRPVGFGVHKLMVRPRDSHALRLINASLELSPPGQTRWIYDAHGNSICYFTPGGEATELRIVSNITVDRYPASLQPMDDPHSALPLVYSQSDRVALGPMLDPVTDDEAASLSVWLRGYMGHPSEPVLYYLQRLNQAIRNDFEYAVRHEEGVQSPVETLQLRRGTCRDFAWLMVEALRRLNIAARFVSGYIYSPGQDVRGAGSTHAWCEAFLPGLGWIEFDPTNGLQESADLIPVASARKPDEASPVSGSVLGNPGACHMHVAVDVQLVKEQDPGRPEQVAA
jgi:YD repeat-containing protein